MAAKHNITIRQGATFALNIALKNASNTPVDLTGYTARGQLRPEYTSDEYVDFTASISTPALGIVTISLTAQQTELLESMHYVYDIEVVSLLGEPVYRVIEGTATVYPEVTRQVLSSSSSSSGA